MVEIYQQAAAIPFRKKKDKVEILLVTSRGSGKWIIPKGLIDPGDSAPFTALKETIEEAGVKGQVSPEIIGNYEYAKWGGKCRVTVFAMHVETIMDEWEEMAFRKRHWFDLHTAIKKVKPSAVKKILHQFSESELLENHEKQQD